MHQSPQSQKKKFIAYFKSLEINLCIWSIYYSVIFSYSMVYNVE